MKSAKYIKSITNLKDSPNKENFSEFVFMGRSNVGKSSLINATVNMKKLAYTSSEPGKTIALNYYLIDDEYYLVDVPGYGYAKRSIKTRLDFGSFIEGYLTKNPNLKCAFLLIDAKVGFTDDDVLMYNYLVSIAIPFKVVLTKIDKIPKTHVYRYTKTIKEEVEENVIITSSSSKQGIDDLRKVIEELK